MSGRTLRYTLVGALVLAIGIPSVAIGFGEGRTMLLGKRNPSPSANRALNSETEIIASNGTYGTRQSNKRDGDGGGAIYGCRSNTGAEPCIRANNLKGGRAFEFETVGKEGGRIETGDVNGAPLTTNATGVATGLNADRVDGKEATDFAAAADFKTAVVNQAGHARPRSRGHRLASRGRDEHLHRDLRPRRLAVHLHRHADRRHERPDALGAGRRRADQRPRRRGPEPDRVPPAGHLLS